MSVVVHINGWPGVGKLTIARLLAQALGARLLDNHTLINPAEALMPRDDPAYYPFRERVRALVLDQAARLPKGTSLVLTDAIAADEPRHQAMFDDCVRLAQALDAAIVSVVLDCEPAENARRLGQESRRELRKLTGTERLAEIRAVTTLLRPQGVPRIDLDVTHLSAQAAAAQLAERIAGL
jgi:predicted kinase